MLSTLLRLFLLSLILIAPAIGNQAAAQNVQIPSTQAEIQLSFAPLVRSVAPAVVNIFTSRTVLARQSGPLFNDPFFERFFGEQFQRPGLLREETRSALGSGVVVRPTGLVVTNHHVIEDAEEITIILSDLSEYEADVVVSDPQTDLALLQIRDLTDRSLLHLHMSDSDDLEVGDLVLAIGNPFGVGQTVTSGIVSAQARTGVGISDFSFFIQTDAAINPGNSGGALIAMDGTLIGINTAIFNRREGSSGIGFAIPSIMVRALIASVDRGTPLARPWLGAQGQTVDADMAERLGLPRPAGILITGVSMESPAYRAGVRNGDVILSVNGRTVENVDALRFRVASLLFDEMASVTVWRDRGVVTLDLPVEPPPETPPRNTTVVPGTTPLTGAQVANLSPALIAEIGFDGDARAGVVVLSVVDRSLADRFGLREMDVIQSINGVTIADVATVLRIARNAPPPWNVAIRRGNRTITAVIGGR
ncbi:MAG: Do family serine endopeptidase [Pseudomonadota bacterium]